MSFNYLNCALETILFFFYLLSRVQMTGDKNNLKCFKELIQNVIYLYLLQLAT